MSARIAAYRRQNGRESLTPRQYRQVSRMETRQLAKARRALHLALHPDHGETCGTCLDPKARTTS